MKQLELSTFCSLLFLLVLSACKTDEPMVKSLEEQRQDMRDKLTAIMWQTESVLRDGLDITAEYTGFTISFEDGRYNSTSGSNVWPSSGTWKFVDDKSDEILRDDGTLIKIEVKDNQLIMTFEFDDNVLTLGGRPNTVASDYMFTMIN